MFATMCKRIAAEKPKKGFQICIAAVRPMNKTLAVTLPNLVVETGLVAVQVVADVETRLCRQAIAVQKASNVAEKTYSTQDIAAWKMSSAAMMIAVPREPNVALRVVCAAAREKHALMELAYK